MRLGAGCSTSPMKERVRGQKEAGCFPELTDLPPAPMLKGLAEEREPSAVIQWALSSCNASAWHPALGIPLGLAPRALLAQAAGLGEC